MANFSVTSNNFLRNLYAKDRALVNTSERAKVSTKELGKADSKALGKGVSALSSFDYDAEVDDETKFYKTLKSFADSYNNTIESGSAIAGDDSGVKSVMKDMKKLQEKYGDKLEEYGISFDSKGYMSISETAMDEIKTPSFKNLFGKESEVEFLGDLSALAKRLTRRINYLV